MQLRKETMKPIRNIQYAAVAMLGVMLSASCSQLLDEPLENQQIAEETDYSRTENMTLMLYGAYNELYNLQWETFPLVSVRGDDIDVGGRGDQPLLAQADS